MRCPDCGGETYLSIGGDHICSKCGRHSSTGSTDDGAHTVKCPSCGNLSEVSDLGLGQGYCRCTTCKQAIRLAGRPATREHPAPSPSKAPAAGGPAIDNRARRQECDVCAARVKERDGYLQVVTNPAYWQYVFSHQWAYVEDMPDRTATKGAVATRMAREKSPWIVCESCAEMLGGKTEEARTYALAWWASGGRFTPPGSGPVPVEEVRVVETSADVSRSGLPKPSRVHVFGNGFQPSYDDVERGGLSLCQMYEQTLVPDHFGGIVVRLEEVGLQTREAFMKAVCQFISQTEKEHPGAHVADAFSLDQRSGRDIAFVAMWEGPSAEIARRLLTRRS